MTANQQPDLAYRDLSIRCVKGSFIPVIGSFSFGGHQQAQHQPGRSACFSAKHAPPADGTIPYVCILQPPNSTRVLSQIRP